MLLSSGLVSPVILSLSANAIPGRTRKDPHLRFSPFSTPNFIILGHLI